MTSSKSIPMLNSDGTNFLMWKKKLFIVLENENIAYVLTDPKTPDVSEDLSTDDEEILESYEKKRMVDDSCCQDHILNSIDKDLSIMFQYRPTAKSLMDGLTNHFKPTLSRRIALHRRYFLYNMPLFGSINRHVARMEAAVAELEAVGVEVPEMTKVITLIDSLPRSWRDAVLSSSTNLEEDLTVEVVIQRMRSIGDTRDLYKKQNLAALIGAVYITAVCVFLVFDRR